MPELPEVQTTVNGLSHTIVGLRIDDVWSDYNSPYFKGADNIKNPRYFDVFRKKILNKKVLSVSRRAKNILIHLEGGLTMLIHMKMTGHLLFGRYEFRPVNKSGAKISPWIPISPESLKDPFNRHIHFVLTFKKGAERIQGAQNHLALCDSRKFAKVTLIDSAKLHDSIHIKDLGPEPLEKSFTFEKFVERLNTKSHWKIKLALMDQTVMAGIGNIYADESLWRAEIHPMELVSNISKVKMLALFKAIKQTLERGIDFGGDSMSDYRNVHGERGKFQEQHRAYQKTGEKCSKKGCRGTIRRIVVGTRGTHYCDKHQVLSSRKAR